MCNKAIGVFDSGLGGLTVLKELKKLLPNENFVYFGDTGRVPYGTRSAETILKYAKEDQSFLISKDVKIIIAACGTVSSLMLENKPTHNIPFFEMITPAVNMASTTTKAGNIGVIGTNATVNSNAHKNMLLNKNKSFKVTAAACPLFVPLVENGIFNGDDEIVKEVVARHLKPIKEAGCDTLILGCTHYPILKDAIKNYLGDTVLINPGVALANSVKEYLEQNNLLNQKGGNIEYYVSDRPASFKNQVEILLGEQAVGEVTEIDIEG